MQFLTKVTEMWYLNAVIIIKTLSVVLNRRREGNLEKQTSDACFQKHSRTSLHSVCSKERRAD